jgi:hypothetical protein
MERVNAQASSLEFTGKREECGHNSFPYSLIQHFLATWHSADTQLATAGKDN